MNIQLKQQYKYCSLIFIMTFMFFNILSTSCYILKDHSNNAFLGIKDDRLVMINEEDQAMNIAINKIQENKDISLLTVGQKSITATKEDLMNTIHDGSLHLEKTDIKNKAQHFKILYDHLSVKNDKGNKLSNTISFKELKESIRNKTNDLIDANEGYDSRRTLSLQHDSRCIGYTNLLNEKNHYPTISLINCDDEKNVIKFIKSDFIKGSSVEHEVGAPKTEVLNFDNDSYKAIMNDIIKSKESANDYLRERAFETTENIKDMISRANFEVKRDIKKEMREERYELDLDISKRIKESEMEQAGNESDTKTDDSNMNDKKFIKVNHKFSDISQNLKGNLISMETEKSNFEISISKYIASSSSYYRSITASLKEINGLLQHSSNLNSSLSEITSLTQLDHTCSKSQKYASQSVYLSYEMKRIQNLKTSYHSKYEAMRYICAYSIYSSKASLELAHRSLFLAIDIAKFDVSKKHLIILLEKAHEEAQINMKCAEDMQKSLLELDAEHSMKGDEADIAMLAMDEFIERDLYGRQLDAERYYLESRILDQKSNYWFDRSHSSGETRETTNPTRF